jgi:hypothetical protein
MKAHPEEVGKRLPLFRSQELDLRKYLRVQWMENGFLSLGCPSFDIFE